MKNNTSKQGQVLLVVVLLLATTLTIVMTVVFTSRTESNVTRLQQDSERSLAAAEAGIEAAIKSQGEQVERTFRGLSLNNLQGIDLDGSKVTKDNTSSRDFVSPVITKDQQYTLYITPYSSEGFGTPIFQGDVFIYYGSESGCGNLALEFTVVSSDTASTYNVKRYIADAGNKLGSDIDERIASTGIVNIPDTDPEATFNCKAGPIPATLNTKLIFVRLVGNNASPTKLGIKQGQGLPPQGTYFYSEAKTTTGVVKKVQVFQSYPQLPAEYFVTTF